MFQRPEGDPARLGVGVLSLGLKTAVKQSYLVFETSAGSIIFEVKGYT